MAELIQDLLRAVQYLQTEKRIVHGNVNPKSIFLQLDDTGRYWKLKIGDFKEASYLDDCPLSVQWSSEGANIETNKLRGELQAVATITFYLATGMPKNGMTDDDLEWIPDINLVILFLSLREGVMASKALQLPPFNAK